MQIIAIVTMVSRRVSTTDVVKYFNGEDGMLSEVFKEGSDDDLGMEDEFSESFDSEEDSQHGKQKQTEHCLATFTD